ncbi:LppX_LprAFG lipoprotein [Gordonia sp. HY002]|uniref:LppX_LprAFG lipoprotein n=1 Tax=Gordonia zhenghanii TaxID=2911516 RepID=UPI001EF02999|nr:LppX_LprAFG lipoprotein [Gordonia zhenghanii]MCF8569393.1 LppX_LprAFG lipoprotein [Gordonia zhenghanii]MCF8603602.1 LppX_LprAFG lipoprotein [Gordonia zhenghanii]
MNRPHRLIAGGFATAITAAMVLTGCSSSDDDQTKPASDAGAESTLEAAATATQALTGAHVVLSVDGQLQSINATKVDADIETKPKLEGEGTTTLNMGGKSVDAPFVYIDGTLYTNVDGAGFQDYGDGRSIYDISKILDPEAGVANILRNVDGAQEAGEETIDGTATTKITGTVTGKTLSGLTSTAAEGPGSDGTYDATIFITTGDNQVARVVVSPTERVTMTVDLNEWNKSVDVEKPTDVQAPTKKPDAPKSGEPTRDKTN